MRDLAIEADPRLAGSTGEIKTIVERLKDTLAEGGGNKAATAAMANLAEAIHGLVSHMRSEQQMIRDWADAQASQNREMQLLLRRIAGEDAPKV